MKLGIMAPENDIQNDQVVNISGAKNALLPILFAVPLIEGTTSLYKVPKDIGDYKGAKAILTRIGLQFEENANHVTINASNLQTDQTIGFELSKLTRCSIYLLGALAKHHGHFKVGFPGGCAFGKKRQFDLHVEGLSCLGADVKLGDHQIEIIYRGEKDSTYTMAFPSVGATTNLILYAVKGHSQVALYNCAFEPEIIDLVRFLNKSGANIKLHYASRCIEINGVSRMHPISHTLIYDRIQAISYACLAMIHRSTIVINGIDQLQMIAMAVKKLESMGVSIDFDSQNERLTVWGGYIKRLKGICCHCRPYPGFATDWQPLFAALALFAETPSLIEDNVIPERFNYINELAKLGGNIKQSHHRIEVFPSALKMHGNSVNCTDLRGGMACLLACSGISGYSELQNAEQIFRGYHQLIDILKAFGCSIHIEGNAYWSVKTANVK
jgi:UDP-N-acetylglucosamine 1-carboxyvinyltransferase